jgi:hypothetical protein
LGETEIAYSKVGSTSHGCAKKMPLRQLSGRQAFQHDDAMANTPLFAHARNLHDSRPPP